MEDLTHVGPAPSSPSASVTSLRSSTATLLLSLPMCTVLSVSAGTVVRVGSGELRVLATPIPGGLGGDLLLITCGDIFSYPLVDQPVLKAEERVYILPAEASHHFVIYVGADAAADIVSAFDRVLMEATQLRARVVHHTAGEIQYPPSAAGPLTISAAGEAVASAITITGRLAAAALVAGANVAAQGIAWTTRAVIAHVKPRDGASSEAGLSAETMAHLQRAKIVSTMAVTVSAGLVAGAAATAKSLATALTQAMLSTDVGKRMVEAGDTETGAAVKKIAGSGLVAFADVWDGLEQAARTVGVHAAAGIHDVVEHRYGPEAGNAAAATLSVASDVGTTAMNLRYIGVGGIVRRTAAETAREIINTPQAVPPSPRMHVSTATVATPRAIMIEDGVAPRVSETIVMTPASV